VLFTPSGMEAFFDRFAASDDPAPGQEAFLRAAEGTGMAIVGPPLAVTHPR
jgi:hypothetical protein